MYILGQIWFNKNKARFDWKYAPAIRAVATRKVYLVMITKFVQVTLTLGVKEIFWIWELILRTSSTLCSNCELDSPASRFHKN